MSPNSVTTRLQLAPGLAHLPSALNHSWVDISWKSSQCAPRFVLPLQILLNHPRDPLQLSLPDQKLPCMLWGFWACSFWSLRLQVRRLRWTIRPYESGFRAWRSSESSTWRIYYRSQIWHLWGLGLPIASQTPRQEQFRQSLRQHLQILQSGLRRLPHLLTSLYKKHSTRSPTRWSVSASFRCLPLVPPIQLVKSSFPLRTGKCTTSVRFAQTQATERSPWTLS